VPADGHTPGLLYHIAGAARGLAQAALYG